MFSPNNTAVRNRLPFLYDTKMLHEFIHNVVQANKFSQKDLHEIL